MKNSMEKVTKSKEIKIPQKMSSNKVNCASNFKSTFAQSLSYSNSCDESVVTRKMEKGKNPLLKQGFYGDNYNKSDEDKQKQLWNTNKQVTKIKNLNTFYWLHYGCLPFNCQGRL